MTFWEGFNLVGHVANFVVMAALVGYCRYLVIKYNRLEARVNSLEISHASPLAHETYLGKPREVSRPAAMGKRLK